MLAYLPRFDGTEQSLAWAACMGDLNAAAAMLDDGADVSARDEKGRTPLHCAAGAYWPKMIELLLANGADPNERDNDGRTPLHRACSYYVGVYAGSTAKPNPKKPRKECAQLLLNAGADPNALNLRGQPPLTYAPLKMDLIDCLLAGGADINLGSSPLLHYSVSAETVQQFVDRGYDITNTNSTGWTLLHITKLPPTCELLLKLNADPNARDEAGQTPLHRVCYEVPMVRPIGPGLAVLAQLLISHGADRSARDNKNRIPIDCMPDQEDLDPGILDNLREICTPVAKGAHA